MEQALQVVEAGEGEVVVLTVGPDDDAADPVRKVLQMGDDSGIHVQDDAIQRSDAFATSAAILAKAIERSATTTCCSSAWPRPTPASASSRRWSPSVSDFRSSRTPEISVDGDTVKIRRDGDVTTQDIEAPGKVVVSVTDQTGEARYPSFKGIMAVKKKPVG